MIWLVFLLSFPTGLGGFSPSYIHTPTRSTGLTSKREGNCNGLVTRPGHVIPTVCQWSRDPDIDLDSSFASNQTSDIFHPKILHASLSASDLSRTDLDITSYTLALALFGEEVLHVLRSRGQAACLMTGSREKTTY